MKIVSWNVNGLEACKRKGFMNFLENTNADIFCCQEIKKQCYLYTPEYLQFWNPAARPGYSGTLLLSKREPLSIRYGMGIDCFDVEGRLITAEYEDYYVVNTYVPNSQASQERLDYRVAWDAAFLSYINSLPKPVVLCGDFNVARSYIDVYPENLRNEENPPGFISDEREGMERLLESGFLDVFRTLYPTQEGAYTWWSNRLRKRLENRGWRLDYFIISQVLLGHVYGIKHYTDTLGSDHCPISLILNSVSPRKEMSSEDMAVMWRGADWDKLEDQLFAKQRKIAAAAASRNWQKVEWLQRELVNSLYAKMLAVRHVVKNNSEPGVDGVKWTTDEEMMRAALSLRSYGYRAKPNRDFELIEEERTRHIRIPIAYDKAMQALHAFSLDPVAESTADKKSFSARKGRSTLDAYAHLCRILNQPDPPRWVLRADVKACYDSISHKWLIENIPMDKHVLRECLHAGLVSCGDFFPTNVGISLGASLSPILGNMVLDGLQAEVRRSLYPNPDGEIDYANGEVVRYADDIVITARTYEDAEKVRMVLEDFLLPRGLRLNEDKTYISNVDIGFEYLSRWYQRRQGVLVVKPSDKAVVRMEHRLESFIMGFKGSQRNLIAKLNKKLTGYATYYRVSDAYMEFRRIDATVQVLLLRKMKLLHPKSNVKKVAKKYWMTGAGGYHFFTLTTDKTIRVLRLAAVEITEHRPCRVSYNPYLDGEYARLLQYRRDIRKASGQKLRAIWNRQEGKCEYCGQSFLPDQDLDVVERVIGRGRGVHNLCYIHRRCIFDTLSDAAEISEEHLDLITMLTDIAENEGAQESPYLELSEYFRLCDQSLISLTFQQIESILGDGLSWEAYFYRAFWHDDMQGHGEAWRDEGYPFHFFIPEEREFCISESWTQQGYQVKALYLEERRIVFRRVQQNTSGLVVPKALLKRRLPNAATQELRAFFDYIIKKYCL